MEDLWRRLLEEGSERGWGTSKDCQSGKQKYENKFGVFLYLYNILQKKNSGRKDGKMGYES